MSDQLLIQMIKRLVKVHDLDDREEFGNRVLTAWTAKDENEMLKVIKAFDEQRVVDVMNVHLEPPPPSKKQTGFAYFYRYKYRETDKEVKAKNPERQARDVTNELFLLWDSLTKEEQKEWTDSAPDEPEI